MKILYASNTFCGSKLRLKRFLKHSKKFDLKIAAYKNCSDLNINWCLDSLLNPFQNVKNISFKNDNFKKYLYAVKEFNPDLIISDLEIYSSYIGIELGIKVWQVSPVLLYYALDNEFKYKLNIYKFHQYNFTENKKYNQYINYIINNSKNYIYSHFADIEGIPIDKKFKWIRPYYILGNEVGNKENYIGISINNNKKIIKYLPENSSYFCEENLETYEKVKMYNINDDKNYREKLGESKFLISNGDSNILTDGFYNRKKNIILHDNDLESIINFRLNNYFKEDLEISLNEKIKFLHEEIRCI